MCQEVCLFRLGRLSLCRVSVLFKICQDSEHISAEGQEDAMFYSKLSLQDLGVCLSVFLPSVRAELHVVRSMKQSCALLPQTRRWAR